MSTLGFMSVVPGATPMTICAFMPSTMFPDASCCYMASLPGAGDLTCSLQAISRLGQSAQHFLMILVDEFCDSFNFINALARFRKSSDGVPLIARGSAGPSSRDPTSMCGDGLIGLEELFQVCSNVYGSLTEKELKLAQRRTSVKVLAKSPSKLMTEKPSFLTMPLQAKSPTSFVLAEF